MTLYVHINFIFVKNGLTVYDISYVWREMDTSRRFVQLPSARLHVCRSTLHRWKFVVSIKIGMRRKGMIGCDRPRTQISLDGVFFLHRRALKRPTKAGDGTTTLAQGPRPKMSVAHHGCLLKLHCFFGEFYHFKKHPNTLW
jgi:hypothetical protein